MASDPIADLLTQIRNASMANLPSATTVASKAKEQLLSVLKEEGYIDGYERISEGNKAWIKVHVRYSTTGSPAIKVIQRLSSPGRRMYVGKERVPRIRGGLGTVVVSTPQGVMTDREARKRGIGGELVCSVF